MDNVVCIHNGTLWSICTIEYYLTEKERNVVVCDNMDWIGEHCTQWNKLGTEKQILRVLTYICVDSKTMELKEAESGIEVSRGEMMVKNTKPIPGMGNIVNNIVSHISKSLRK